MSDSKLNRLIHRKANTAWKMTLIRAELDPLIEERYGIHPSEIDCDPAIDALDYGTTPDYSLAQLDADMTERGHPPKSKK